MEPRTEDHSLEPTREMRVNKQIPIAFREVVSPESLLTGRTPLYTTDRGAAYVGNSLDLLRELPEESVNLLFTSPPYALHFRKAYGNAAKDEYVAWFLPFAKEIQRVSRQTAASC